MIIHRLLLLFLLYLSGLLSSQQYAIGKVSSESDREIAGAIVFNMRTDQSTPTDQYGNFAVAARPGDQLRIVKKGFERFTLTLNNQHFTKSVNITLIQAAHDIEEVKLTFRPTGDLKKDSKALDQSPRKVALNNYISGYMRQPVTEVVPTLKTPSLFEQPKYPGGVDVFAAIGLVVKLIKKNSEPAITKASYAETQQFFRRIKNEVDLSFYYKAGWTEEDIDRFLIYADQYAKLAMRYRKNFNAAVIDRELRIAYKEYVKTHRIGS